MSSAEPSTATGPAHRSIGLILAPVVFIILWASGFTFAKLALAHTAPFTLLTLRYLLATAIMLPVIAYVRPPFPQRREHWAHIVFVGMLIQVVFFSCVMYALELGIDAGGVALIASLQPILVALLAPRVTGERITAVRWLGLALGLAGTVTVILAQHAVGAAPLAGVACATGALLTMTTVALYQKRFGAAHHPVAENSIQYAVGLVVAGLAAWSFEDMTVEWTTEFGIALAYLVLANSLVAVTLLLFMIRRGEAARVSALFFLVPPTAVLIAWAILGETLPLPAIPAMIVVALGVWLVNRPDRRARTA